MKTLLHVFVLLFAFSAAAQGRVEVLSNYSSGDGTSDDGTVGFGFMPYIDLTLVEIGVFDSVVTEIQAPVTVGLWNNAGTLIASESVSSLSPLLNQTRYAVLSSEITLQAYQTYFIGAFLPHLVGLQLAGGFFQGGADISPAVKYLGWARVDSSTLMKPSLVQNGEQVIPGVVNVQHKLVPVPEPGIFSLLALGLGAFALLRKSA